MRVGSFLAVCLTAVLSALATNVRAFDDAQYPNWKGQWRRYLTPGLGGQGAFDQTKLWGKGQQAPLTPKYQKVMDASMADQAKGGLGNYPPAQCLPGGIPRMTYFGLQEYVITPDTTYLQVRGGGAGGHGRRPPDPGTVRSATESGEDPNRARPFRIRVLGVSDQARSSQAAGEP